jgi:hypothetical protein
MKCGRINLFLRFTRPLGSGSLEIKSLFLWNNSDKVGGFAKLLHVSPWEHA